MIFLIRHGEAAAGWGDHPDPGLSEAGQQQAAEVAGRLVARGATSIVSSPMQRCLQTAAPFAARTGLVPEVIGQVSEIATPAEEQDRVGWLRRLMAGTWSDAGTDYVSWREALYQSVSQFPDGTAVFSHFVAINALAGRIEADDRVLVFHPAHCSMTCLERSGGRLRVAEYGNQVHSRIL